LGVFPRGNPFRKKTPIDDPTIPSKPPIDDPHLKDGAPQGAYRPIADDAPDAEAPNLEAQKARSYLNLQGSMVPVTLAKNGRPELYNVMKQRDRFRPIKPTLFIANDPIEQAAEVTRANGIFARSRTDMALYYRDFEAVPVTLDSFPTPLHGVIYRIITRDDDNLPDWPAADGFHPYEGPGQFTETRFTTGNYRPREIAVFDDITHNMVAKVNFNGNKDYGRDTPTLEAQLMQHDRGKLNLQLEVDFYRGDGGRFWSKGLGGGSEFTMKIQNGKFVLHKINATSVIGGETYTTGGYKPEEVALKLKAFNEEPFFIAIRDWLIEVEAKRASLPAAAPLRQN
jgi:hypothetical protein